MRRLFFIALMFVLAASLILSGCSTKQAAQEQKQEQQQEQKPDKVYELKFNDWAPQAIITGKYHDEAAKIIAERTNGKVKITNYYSGSLLGFPDTYTGVASGVADISVYQIDVTQGVHDLNRIFNLPFTADAPHFLETTKIFKELLNKFPEFQKENEKLGTRWLGISALPGYHMSTVKKEVKVPEDFKGLKLSVGGNPAEMVAIMNQIGVGLIPSSPADGYTNLERGLSEGLFFHFPAKDAFKYTELLKYHAKFGEGGMSTGGFGYIINLDTWNSLPAEYQQIIQETYQWSADELAKYNTDYEKQILEKLKTEGHTVVELTPAELQKWYGLAQPQVDKWMAATEAKGWPAKKIYAELQRLMKEAK